MVRLVALKSHTPDGTHRYKPGDTYELSAKSARLVIATKMAKLAEPEEPKKNRREYKRRDLKAEE